MTDELRLGFSSSLFVGINTNDAKASMRALISTVSQEKGVPANVDPPIYYGTHAIAAALKNDEADAVALTVDEFWVLQQVDKSGEITLDTSQRDPLEHYILLVQADSPYQTLADLRAKTITLRDSSRMRVGFIWLDVLLGRQGLPPSEQFFQTELRHTKLSKAVLDLYFKKTDACLVSVRGFETMKELNPKVGRTLRPLAQSEGLVTRMFVFRQSNARAIEDRIVNVFKDLHLSAAGRQALTIFQVERIETQSAESLKQTLELMEEYRTLHPASSAQFIQDVSRGLAPVAP